MKTNNNKRGAVERFTDSLKQALENHYTTKKKVKVSDLKKNMVQERPLPLGFINRVIAYKAILKEVETSDLEKTINNFQRDIYPEYELEVWEGIAESYQRGLEIMDNPTLEDKKDWYQQLLEASLSVN